MADEDYFAKYDNAKDDDYFAKYTRPAKPEPDPGYLGETWRGLKHGVEVTLPESTGKALKFFGAEDTGQGLIDYAKSNDTPDLQESAVGKKARDDAWYSIRGNIAPAADNAVLSLAPGAAGAAIGAGIGMFAGPGGAALGALAGYGIGSIASLPIFYGSQAQESYEAVLKHQRDIGTPEEDAQRIANKTAHVEGFFEAGGELAQDIIPFAKLFKAFGKPVAKAVVSGVLKPTLAQAGKTVGQVVGGEVVTEMGQQAGEDWARKAIGDTGEGATWDETRKVIVPTALMSVFPGAAGAGAHHYKRTVALNALSSPETDPDMRARIAVGAAAAMADGNEDVSRAFAKYASDQIEAKAPIEIKDDDQFYLQYKLSAAKTGQEAIDAAEAALAAPVDALSPDVAAFQSDFDANRVPTDSAVAPIGVDLQGPPAPTPAIALPTDTVPATGPIADVPLSLTSEQIVATADRLSGMPVGAQTQELLALPRADRQAVVKAMQPSGIVTPTVLDAGQGQAGILTNDATTAASSVQPVGNASATNVPAYTERAARERVSKETGMEMRPHRDVPNRYEVVPVTPEPTSNARIAPPTLPVSPTQQQLAEQETPAAPATRPVVPAKPLTPAQLELNRMAADAERSSLPRKSIFRNSQLRDADAPDIKGEKVTHNMRRFLTLIGKLTGTKVVFEYAPEDSEGAVPIRGENVIHINTAAQINPLQVMGHEVTHVLKDRHREAWITIRDALVATMPDKRAALDAFAEDYWHTHPDRLEAARAMPDWSQKLTPEQMREFNSGENTIEAFLLDELTSDLGGSHWSSEQFWTDVFAKIEKQHGGEKAKGIIQRLVASIKEALNKFLMVVRAQKQGDYTTVTPDQLEKTRDAVTSAYAKFINEERTATPEHSPRTLDRRISTSDVTSRSQGSEPAPAPEKQQAAPAPATGDIDDLEAAREDELSKLSPQRKDQRLFFEVAPNPKDAAAVAAWQQRTDKEKQTVSNDVVERIIPGLLRDIGVTGKVVTQLGGWKAHTNPSFALVVTRGDPALAARAIGYVLDQEAVYAMGLKSFTGSTKTGIIQFKLDGKKAHDIYKQVRELARAVITGHSTVGNEMFIGLPTAQMDRLESAIVAIARKNDVTVRFDEGHGAIIKEKDYGIQHRQGDNSGQHSAEGHIADWRTKARAAFSGADRSDAGSGGSDRAVSRSEVRPSYGKAIDQHAVSVTGVHYSNAKRTELNSEFYGTGYRGAERARLASATDPRIKRRVYFYTNNGSGINPESGVGYHAHSVDLQNLYDGDADPLNLSDPDSNKFESNVIDAGYDGYYTRNFGQNGAAVLLGAHAVPVAYEGIGTRPDVPARMSEARKPVDIESAEFKRWFGDSKVVDEQGRPLRVYHGTAADIEAFDGENDSSKKDQGYLGRGFYFSGSADTAGSYANMKGGMAGPNIMPVYLSLKNPLRLKMTKTETKIQLIREALGLPYKLAHENVTREAAQEVTDEAIELGFDGVILDYSEFGGDMRNRTEFTVFRPTQIKSAISNTGAFSSTNPDIRRTEQRPPSWYYSPLARAAESATMKTAPASGWKDWLKSLPAKGVKPDEIKWSGIEEWLDVQGKQPVTKQQVQSFLSDFGIKVETILRGERNPRNGEAVSQDIDADEEPADIEITFGEWETDEPDESWLAESAGERLQDEIDERIEQERANFEDELRNHVEANITPESYVDDIRSDAGKLFQLTDDELSAEANRRAAMDYAAEHWQSFADDPDITLDTGTEEQIEQAMERAFAVASGDMAALEEEARRRARADIDEDKLLEELIDRERQYYYDDYESPATRTISVEGVTPDFYHTSSYGEQQLTYQGNDIRLPRNADDADIEGAIRAYLADEGLLPDGVSPSDGTGFIPVKWEGYTTDKGRAVSGSYREVQLTLPPGTHGEVKTNVLKRDSYTVFDADGNAVLGTVSEESAKREADRIGGRWEHKPDELRTERADAKDFIYTVHWNEKNVVGFARFDVHIDKDGKRVMVLQEIQGDWGQQLRDGLKAQAEMARLDDLLVEKQQEQSRARDVLRDLLPDTAGWSNDEWRSVERLGSQGMKQTTNLASDEYTAADRLMRVSDQLRELYKKYSQAESDARDIPDPAPFISTKKFAVFKDGVEVTRTDKNGKELAERYGSMKDAEAAAAKKGGEARDLGPQVDTPGWTTLVMKRMIAHAIEYGFDKIVWTNGAQQVERWKQRLRSQVDTIQWEKTEEGVHIVGLYRSRQVVDTKVKETALSSAIGKLMAKQIIADPNQSGEITGDGITIDDLGMHGYYDEIVPFTVNKLLEKLDKNVRVGMHEVHPSEVYGVMPDPDSDRHWAVYKGNREIASYSTQERAEAELEKLEAAEAARVITTQQGFEITDKLKESAANGLSLMSERRRAAADRKANDRRAWYYSQLSVAVNDIPRKIKTGKEAALWLQSNAAKLGVKKDELVWSGVLDWLAVQPTPAGVNDWLRDNGVRVREVVLGEESPEYLRLDAELQEQDAEVARLRKKLDVMSFMSTAALTASKEGDTRTLAGMGYGRDQTDTMLAYGRALNRKNELFEQRKAARSEPVKYDTPDLTLPGGSRYRELLLTLPGKPQLKVVEHPSKKGFALQYDNGAYVTSPDGGTTTEQTFDADKASLWDKKEYISEGIRAHDKTQFIGSHFPQPNIIAHLRFNERTDADGKRVLFIEEVQSDYAQAGRRERKKIVAAKAKELGITEEAASKLVPLSAGFGIAPRYSVIDKNGHVRGDFKSREEADAYRKNPPSGMREFVKDDSEIKQTGTAGIPAAPFVTDTKAWTAIALKRAIAYAVDNGFDRVAWTTGEQQADRYSLAKTVNEISWRVRRGNKNVTVELKDGDQLTFHLTTDNTVDHVDGTGVTAYNGKPFDEVIGKDAATKVAKSDDGRLVGDGLRIGGEGMIKSYGHSDPNLPVGKDKAGKDLYPIMTVVARSLGATMGTVQLGQYAEPAIWKKIASHGYQYLKPEEVTQKQLAKNSGGSQPSWLNDKEWEKIGNGEHLLLVDKGVADQPGFDITPRMKAQARIGMPLFSEPRRAAADNQKLWREGYELEGHLFGGSRSITRLRIAAKDAPIRKLIPVSQARYNEIRRELGLQEVTDWTKHPDQLVQHLKKDTAQRSEPRRPLDQWLGKSKVRTVMYHGTARDITTFRPQQVDAIFLTDNPEFAANFADLSHDWMMNNYWTWMTPDQIQQAKRDAMRLLLQDALPGSSFYMREERMLNQSRVLSKYMRTAVEKYMPSESNIMPLYVRAENPFDYRNPEHVAAIEREIGTSWMGQEAINGEMHEVSQHIGDLERGDWNAIESPQVQAYIRQHHDSFYVRERGVTNLAVFSPNQVKSASGNTGAYSRDNNDIRRSEARVPNDEMKRINMAQRFGEGLSVVPEDMFKRDTNPGIEYSGIYQTAAEHIGDLIHRLSYREEQGGGVQYGIEAAINKASRFVKASALDDALDQLDRNYEYHRDERGYKGSKEEFKRDFRTAATRYAEAYKDMPYATLPQFLAKRAAVNLGELNFPAVRANLRQLIEILESDTAEENYWAPFAAGETARRSEGRRSAVDEARAALDNTNADATEEEIDEKETALRLALMEERNAQQGDTARQSTPRSRMTGQPINQSWTDPVVTDWDDLARKMQDDKIDTKRVLRAIRDAGIAVKTKFDAYLLETNYHGRASARVDAFADGELRKLMEDMAMRKLSMADLDDYLWARHAPERNAQNAKSNPARTDGSGMSDAQSAAILAGQAVTVGTRTIQLTPAALRAAAAVSSRVDAITKGTLDLLVSYGLETQQTVDTWKRTYAHYAPLKRDMESDANYSGAFNLGNGTGAGFDVRGSASKRALGSKRAVTDVLANIAMQRERAIARGEKNRVAQAVYGLALSAPNPEFWIPVNTELNKRLSPAALAKVVAELVSIGVNPIDAQNLATEPVQRFIDPNTGLESQRINPALRSRENVLSTRINGEERYVFFSNKKRAQEMVRGLKNLDAAQVSGALQVIAPVTRWFASINTQYNPIFGLTNGVRDFSTGMLNLSSTDIADKRSEVAREAFAALRGVYADLRDHRAGRAPTSQWAQLFEQFAMDGGQTGYRDAYATSSDRADAIAEELKHAGKGQNWLAVGEKRSHIFGWLSDYNTAVENAMRLASYKVYLDKFLQPGMTAQQQQDVRDKAAFTAKNLTVNFNKKGLAAVQTGALYAFFNASVQGTARIAETTLKDGKLTDAGKKIVYGGIMLGVLQAMLGAAAGWDDDEPPQFSREKNFIIPILGTDKVVNVPMPLGFHVLPNIGRIAAEWMMSGFKNPGKRITRMAGMLLDSFNPIGSGTLAQTLSPTIGDPIIALGENKDWTGKSIYKEDFDKLHPTPGWTRAKDTASPPSRWLSYAINYATGGGKYGIGMASPTPDTLDYLVSQATGGTGRELLKVAQYTSAKVSGEELPMHKVPLGVGRFIGETKGQSSEVNRFYGNLQRIGEHKSALDEMKHAGDGAAIQAYLAENPDARMVQTADKAQREIAYLRRQKREVLEKGGNAERVKMLDERITATAARYNQVLRGR